MAHQDPAIEAKVLEAVAFARQQEKPDLKAIARKFDAPYHMVYRRYNGANSKFTRPGANKRLSDAQEAVLKTYLQTLQKMGASLQLGGIECAANHFLKRAWEAERADAPEGSFDDTEKPISATRHFAHDPLKVLEYFNNYTEPYGDKRKIVVSTSQKKKNHYIASDSDRKSLTITDCINGAGSVVPPMTIFGCSNILAKFCRNDLPDGTLFNTSEFGFVSDIITLQRAEHFNKRTLNHRRGGAWRLLLVDAHGSHATVQFIEYMEANQIAVVKMPPHLTHLLQPLNLKVFSPYKAYHRQHVNAATTIGLEHYDKTKFLNELTSVRKKTFKSSTIMSAWKAAGIIQWNPDIVINKMMESNTDTPNHNKTTTTKMNRNDRELSPLLEKFVKGSLQAAYAADKLAEDYDRMRNRKEDSDRRRSGGGRHLLPGGSVTADFCRDIDARQLEQEARAKERREWRQLREALYKLKRARDPLFEKDLRSAATKYRNRMRKRCGRSDDIGQGNPADLSEDAMEEDE